MAYGLSNGHVTDDVIAYQSRVPNLVRGFASAMPSRCTNNLRGIGHVTPTIFCIRSNISPKLLELETSNLVGGFVLGMPSRRTNNFPESGRGLGHVTPTFFGSTVGYPSDSLASCLSLLTKFLFNT